MKHLLHGNIDKSLINLLGISGNSYIASITDCFLIMMRVVTCDLRPVTCDLRPVTYDLWPMTCDLWPVTYDLWPVTYDRWPVTYDLWPVTYDLWPVTCDLWPVTCDLQKKPVGFEFIKVCMETQRFCGKSKFCLYLWIKFTYPVAVLYFLMFASSSGRSNAISASYRSVGFHC